MFTIWFVAIVLLTVQQSLAWTGEDDWNSNEKTERRNRVGINLPTFREKRPEDVKGERIPPPRLEDFIGRKVNRIFGESSEPGLEKRTGPAQLNQVLYLTMIMRYLKDTREVSVH